MSANESNPVDAFGVQAEPRPAFRVRSFAARAFLLAFGFVAALVAVAFLVQATRSQMKWQVAPNVTYLPARPAPLPPSNRAPTPADVGDIDESVGANTGMPQLRPGLAPGYQAAPVEPSYTPSFAPTYTPSSPLTPRPEVRPRPAPRTEAPAPRPAPAPPRASAGAPEPAKAGGYRRVAGKTFKQQEDGFLVDTSYRADAGLTVVEVKAGGPEYARLLEEHRALAQFFRLSDRLVVVLDGVVYRVVP